MNGPERIETARLVLRKPAPSDAEAIFTRYASDPVVARYLGWPRHQSIEQTHSFLEWSESRWTLWPAGAYLIESRHERKLLGSTGLDFETPVTAITGYVLARDAWGLGYATEALTAMVATAQDLGVERLSAHCHPDHHASIRVLEKCGFVRESLLREYLEFPNLGAGKQDCLCYVRTWPARTTGGRYAG